MDSNYVKEVFESGTEGLEWTNPDTLVELAILTQNLEGAGIDEFFNIIEAEVVSNLMTQLVNEQSNDRVRLLQGQIQAFSLIRSFLDRLKGIKSELANNELFANNGGDNGNR